MGIYKSMGVGVGVYVVLTLRDVGEGANVPVKLCLWGEVCKNIRT